LDNPDIQAHLVPYVVKDVATRTLQPWPGLTMSCYQLRPESLGSVHARSADPYEHPAIRFNFLSDPLDRRTMLDGVRFMRRLASATALDGFRGAEMTPGPDVQTDEEILEYVSTYCQTAYHPIGTCRMGPGVDTVVDDHLRVHGLSGLRVADASIMPTMVSGNTNAASIMIGEKAADLLRREHQLKSG
jgi:choline dehydrogenase